MDSTEFIIVTLIIIAVLWAIGWGAHSLGKHLGRKAKEREQQRLWEEQHVERCGWYGCERVADFTVERSRPCGHAVTPAEIPSCARHAQAVLRGSGRLVTCPTCRQTSPIFAEAVSL